MKISIYIIHYFSTYFPLYIFYFYCFPRKEILMILLHLNTSTSVFYYFFYYYYRAYAYYIFIFLLLERFLGNCGHWNTIILHFYIFKILPCYIICCITKQCVIYCKHYKKSIKYY